MLEVPTLSLTCDIYDPLTLEPYSRDPRFIAFKAEEYLRTTGIATTSYWGPEAEFFIFNSVRFDQNAHEGYYHIDAEEGVWNSGRNGGTPNLGHRPRHKEGYFPVPPVDRLQDVRSKIMLALIEAGIPVEVQHHEVATAGQAEIDFRFGTLVQTADRLMAYKYVIKNVCHNLGYTATFMPKPLFGDNGSGMHVHQSLWKGDTAAVLRRERVRAALRDRAALHRRPHRPRAGAAGALRADDQQLPAPGARLRGAGQPHVLGAEPVGHLPDPDLLEQPQGAAGGVPRAGSDRQPVSRVLGACSWPASTASSASSSRPRRSTRTCTSCTTSGSSRSRWCRARWPRRVAALEADHDFLLAGDVFTPDVLETWITHEADQGHRADQPAAASVRVLPVLRRLRAAARRCAKGHRGAPPSSRAQRGPAPRSSIPRTRSLAALGMTASCRQLTARLH